ncbi:uncharacterized protein MYCFIDRAFT_175849 [Pseudocercospora fijiensis CIRAD86]|uniref:Uncharacterized protein n=1 Tax=Pseudocercospora fijiensis (strain CIRAD86) TaxID=383855 RepID=M2YX79_PSEFD|nr:uncharacterized protein MYCFIDRAFT_175849 [Pseudocercospora fijiensis CIRAD86]EME82300.1 hypothetical protein MYCFIDRAFT_175849 [Pseudocercospora fijiensis CIRAD86]
MPSTDTWSIYVPRMAVHVGSYRRGRSGLGETILLVIHIEQHRIKTLCHSKPHLTPSLERTWPPGLAIHLNVYGRSEKHIPQDSTDTIAQSRSAAVVSPIFSPAISKDAAR